jgi:hypothetical protein
MEESKKVLLKKWPSSEARFWVCLLIPAAMAVFATNIILSIVATVVSFFIVVGRLEGWKDESGRPFWEDFWDAPDDK